MLRSLFWKPYSRLLIVGDNAGWSIDEDAEALKRSADALDIPAHIVKRVYFDIPQVVHYNSQFSLNEPSIYKSKHKISVDYYHGKPDQGENFRRCFESLKSHHRQISRVRVSTKEIGELIKLSGVDAEKVRRIPIGVDTEIFSPQTPNKKLMSRLNLDIPANAAVIGSFQKDGVGWSEGNKPKLIKGPDVFLEVIKKLKQEVPNLWVLLSGPSRGYVKNGLDIIGVPYRHRYLKDFRELTDLYDALDLYIITSREEGGPKACLESMAKGVPLITTKVGQCADLVRHRENAMMVAIDDVAGLCEASLELLGNGGLRDALTKEGRETAEENNFGSQLPLWKAYFKDLVTS